MSLSSSTTPSIITGSPNTGPAQADMRHYNWRAPPQVTHNSRPKDPHDPSEQQDEGYLDPCMPVTITTDITLTLAHSSTVVVPQVVTYTPTCLSDSNNLEISPNSGTNKAPTDDDGPDGTDLPASSLRDPFYASTIPMAYSIAMTITLSYVLLFLLLLSTPRPWLQKVATFTVVICLTLALAETTKILETEYSLMGETWTADTESGSAKQIREKVVASTEMRIGRIISDTFLWLAQVQTLIRLFPRHREKIVIKWAGFALIVLDTIFSILVHFLSPTTIMSPENFLDAIPALSYLFQIALSLLYASCVLYYSLSSRIRRFAYYHPKAPNNILIAILSLISVLIPMVFFCLDIGQKDLAAWGDYVRWVGAAAASVVVWEWVDRIERLEREERREGVLGREVFDDDDGLVEDMGISEGDDNRDRDKGNGSDRGPDAPDPERGCASGALRGQSDAATMVVNRHSRNSVASYQYSNNTSGAPTIAPSVVSATRKSLAGDHTPGQPQPADIIRTGSAVTEDSSDSGARRSSISFVGLRNDRPSYSERSTPGLASNRTAVRGDDDDDDRVAIEGEQSLGSQGVRELNEKVDADVGSSSVTAQPSSSKQDRIQESENTGGNGILTTLNPFKRKQPSHISTDERGFQWRSLVSNLPFRIPFTSPDQDSTFFQLRFGSRDTKDRDTSVNGRRPLPVTVIPAPPRGRGISLHELEEARRSGIGDENVKGVGVWTGNSMRAARNLGSVDMYENSNQNQQHHPRQTMVQFQEPRQYYHQSQQRGSSLSSPVQTPSLPPLPPSSATATSSWGGSQYHYIQQQPQQDSLHLRRSTSTSLQTASAMAISESPYTNPSSQPLPLMSGALLQDGYEGPSPSLTGLSRQGGLSGGGGGGDSSSSSSSSGGGGSLSATRRSVTATSLGVVDEVAAVPVSLAQGSQSIRNDARSAAGDGDPTATITMATETGQGQTGNSSL
ncbi:PalH/RIM21-domain-containing protein [Kalaharituber pfeilii]|nr:PalH/RIM21-domain-containing protein [Kalaharituber pfeilii]